MLDRELALILRAMYWCCALLCSLSLGWFALALDPVLLWFALMSVFLARSIHEVQRLAKLDSEAPRV